jgi:hypothetical protein
VLRCALSGPCPGATVAADQRSAALVGAPLATGALTAFGYAVITGAGHGWSAAAVQVSACACVAVAATFLVNEARRLRGATSPTPHPTAAVGG